MVQRLLAVVAGLLLCLGAWAQGGVLPVPELTARVIDQTSTLDATQRQALEAKLAEFERTRGSQIVMLLVPTTQPEDIASYANRVANAWKIGRREVGDGILVIVAKDDRRVRIEVAKTLEGAVPDLAARQVIETLAPRFRQGDYAGGLQAAADQLIARINGEALPAPARQGPGQPGAAGGFNWFDLAIFLFFAVPIAATVLRGILGSKLGPLVTGAGAGALALTITSSLVLAVAAGIVALIVALMTGGFGGSLGGRRRSHGGIAPPIILGGGGFGGGGGGGGWGGGGGGFGSGGGGDFGGGGASGDW